MKMLMEQQRSSRDLSLCSTTADSLSDIETLSSNSILRNSPPKNLTELRENSGETQSDNSSVEVKKLQAEKPKEETSNVDVSVQTEQCELGKEESMNNETHETGKNDSNQKSKVDYSLPVRKAPSDPGIVHEKCQSCTLI
eukprot:CAMPEP_0184487070 /NCGR_PEP_ID=MMETSP0113_2-20130426/9146_1 /TAXON_ID=91329 /ORGANISM="Norrisiella sphaerica, Strain BC52" /LENGTH=139 /DNA_ID=CAMNT_0026869235 /DNA_START=78 /DNA_END=497 /DNA_ORIENTATION=-